jgi:hypothetical protein
MRAIAWSPDGTMLAVGYGGRTGTGRSRKDGAFVLLKASDLSTIHEGQDSRDWISEIKFSPDSSLLAMSSQVGSRCSMPQPGCTTQIGRCAEVICFVAFPQLTGLQGLHLRPCFPPRDGRDRH